MDGGGVGAFVASPSPWSLVRGYFSPATLFLLLNMVIGTIALTSRSHRRRYRRDDDDDGHHWHYHPPPHHQYALAPPPPLARTSSVMDRLWSLGLYRFRSGDFPPEYNNNHHLSAATHDAATTAAAHSSSVTKQNQAPYTRSRSDPATRPPSARKNNGSNGDQAVKKSTSASEMKKLERAPPQAQVRRATRALAAPRGLVVREEEDAAAAVSVDARADDFINKFREQLRLQRLNSLLNYKEMLNRGL